MHDYKKIIRKLIKKSFPGLSRRFIVITGSPFQFRRYLAGITYLGFMAWIWVFPLGKKCSKKQLEAVLSHELAHFEIIILMPFWEKVTFAFRWLFTKKGKAWFETRADQVAIEKGYARALYSIVFSREKNMSKKNFARRKRWGYLSSKEIKAYAQKVGKW